MRILRGSRSLLRAAARTSNIVEQPQRCRHLRAARCGRSRACASRRMKHENAHDSRPIRVHSRAPSVFSSASRPCPQIRAARTPQRPATDFGSGGYAGPPENRRVELGYEVVPNFHGRGLGAASARALVAQAFASGKVDRVGAHTLASASLSTGVLSSLGFELLGEHEDSDEGTLWVWACTREQLSR